MTRSVEVRTYRRILLTHSTSRRPSSVAAAAGGGGGVGGGRYVGLCCSLEWPACRRLSIAGQLTHRSPVAAPTQTRRPSADCGIRPGPARPFAYCTVRLQRRRFTSPDIGFNYSPSGQLPLGASEQDQRAGHMRAYWSVSRSVGPTQTLPKPPPAAFDAAASIDFSRWRPAPANAATADCVWSDGGPRQCVYRTAQLGHRDARRKRWWRLTGAPVAETKTMSHTVDSCPLTKLDGGLSGPHSTDDDAVWPGTVNPRTRKKTRKRKCVYRTWRRTVQYAAALDTLNTCSRILYVAVELNETVRQHRFQCWRQYVTRRSNRRIRRNVGPTNAADHLSTGFLNSLATGKILCCLLS